MPNTLITLLPMTLDDAVHLLEDEGCTVDERREDTKVLAMSPDGNYVRVTTDIDGYTTVSVNLALDAVIASDGLATAVSIEDEL